jgi:hypothetical protein
MTAPSYPASSDVTPGQATAAGQYNNLRRDAIRLGAEPADSRSLAEFFCRYIDGVVLVYLPSNRLRVPHITTRPPTLMINGYMCQAGINIDLASNAFSGAAAVWYIFAVRNTGSDAFTLEVNTSPVEGVDRRILGQVYWDGANLDASSIITYAVSGLGTADYDSGWFAVAYGNTYSKAHNLGQHPRQVILLHSTTASPTTTNELVRVTVNYGASDYPADCLGATAQNIIVQTGEHSALGTVFSRRRGSSGGYFRLQAWK